MKKIAAAAAVLFALVTAGSAGAALKVGVAEDTTGYLDGGAAIFNQMHGTGMSVVRMTVIWDENQPTTIQGQGALAGRSVFWARRMDLDADLLDAPGLRCGRVAIDDTPVGQHRR